MSPILWSRMKSSTSQAPWRLKNSVKRADDAGDDARTPFALHRFAVAFGLADPEGRDDGGKREHRTGEIGCFPALPCREEQRERTRACRSDAPAILRHSRSDTELFGLQYLDPVRIDHDVEGRPGEADENGADRHFEQRGKFAFAAHPEPLHELPDRRLADMLRVDHCEVEDHEHDQRGGQDQPRHALAETADDGQAHRVDDPAPTKASDYRRGTPAKTP